MKLPRLYPAIGRLRLLPKHNYVKASLGGSLDLPKNKIKSRA
jgi:hypothetical protein